MKYLIVDDTPEHLKPLAQALRNTRHEVVFARDLGTAWGWLTRGDRFDLVVTDLALDRYIREFDRELSIIRVGLALDGLANLPMSGQALGLRLWCQRRVLRQRYCYITHHMHLWLVGLNLDDPELGGKPREDLDGVVLDKSSLWPDNVVDKFQNAYAAWDQWQWLA